MLNQEAQLPILTDILHIPDLVQERVEDLDWGQASFLPGFWRDVFATQLPFHSSRFLRLSWLLPLLFTPLVCHGGLQSNPAGSLHGAGLGFPESLLLIGGNWSSVLFRTTPFLYLTDVLWTFSFPTKQPRGIVYFVHVSLFRCFLRFAGNAYDSLATSLHLFVLHVVNTCVLRPTSTFLVLTASVFDFDSCLSFTSVQVSLSSNPFWRSIKVE